jgi:hypothetical protein
MLFRTGENGARIYLVSVFSGYSTSAYPVNLTVQPGASTIEGDWNYGASASMGWQRHRELSNLSVVYSPSFNGQAHYSNLNALNHAVQLNASRKFGRKWSVSVSGSGTAITLTQFLFVPSALAVRSQVPFSFDDLAASFALGQFTDSQVASMLTGASPPQSPTQNLLYGYRTLSYSGQVSVEYAYSPRLSFHVSSFALGSQPLHNGSQVSVTYPVTHTIGAIGGVSMSYSLSPRTQLGLNVEEGRQVNHYQSANFTTASGSIGRKMGMHWFVNVSGGYAHTQATGQGSAVPDNQLIGSGTLGFKTYQHTFTASYSRSSTNSYGILGTTSSAGSSWGWHHPGSVWSVDAGFSQEETRNTGFISLSGWEVLSGVTRKLNDRTALTAQYAFLEGSSTYSGFATHLTVHSVRLSVGWSPQVVLR